MAIGARLFTGVLLSALLSTGLFLVPFPTGWEGGIAIVGLEEGNMIYASNCKGYSPETEAILVTSLQECRTGGNSWSIDIDARYGGRPSLLMETQQLSHTDAGGIATNTNLPASSSLVTRNRDTYYIDRHIFMFEFQVRTVADVKEVYCSDVFGQFKNCVFDQETSYFPSSGNCYPDLVLNNRRINCGISGSPFDGSTLILFTIHPWQGARDVPANVVRFDQWVGVMQATVFKTTPTVRTLGGECLSCPEGKVSNAPGSGDFPWAVQNIQAEGSNLNMFYVNGTAGQLFTVGSIESLIQEFGTPPLDRRIPQQVFVELPYKLTAGAAIGTSFGGGVTSVSPIDVFAKYVVRMDIAIVTGWTPQLDYVDSNANGVLDPGEFSFIDKNQDNKWTVGVDEAVSGTPPTPPSTECTITTDVKKEADGTTVTTLTAKCPDGSTSTLVYRETPSLPPSPPTVGCPPLCPPTIQPPADIFFPSCNFFDIECRLSNWQKFPFDLGTTFALALPFLIIAAVVLIATTFFGIAIGKRRGR